MKKYWIILVAALALVGCSDWVQTEFDTLSEAKVAGAFERGWLPPILPDGTTNIIELNNLDTNRGKGSFLFPAESVTAYLETLQKIYGAVVSNSHQDIEIQIAKKTTQWVIKLHLNDGRGEYAVIFHGDTSQP